MKPGPGAVVPCHFTGAFILKYQIMQFSTTKKRESKKKKKHAIGCKLSFFSSKAKTNARLHCVYDNSLLKNTLIGTWGPGQDSFLCWNVICRNHVIMPNLMKCFHVSICVFPYNVYIHKIYAKLPKTTQQNSMILV